MLVCGAVYLRFRTVKACGSRGAIARGACTIRTPVAAATLGPSATSTGARRPAARQPRNAGRAARARGAPLPARVPVRSAGARRARRWRRFLLLELVILPRRPRASAAAYRKIWTAEGSPLLVHGRALAASSRRAWVRRSRSSSRCATASRRSPRALDRFERGRREPARRCCRSTRSTARPPPARRSSACSSSAASALEHAVPAGDPAVLRPPGLPRRPRRVGAALPLRDRARAGLPELPRPARAPGAARATGAAATAWRAPTAARR